MRLYPETAAQQLELDKIKNIIHEYCKTVIGKQLAEGLRIHTRMDYIEMGLMQTHSFKALIDQQLYFPDGFTSHIMTDLKLLGIPGAKMVGEQWVQIRRLTETSGNVFRWFSDERKQEYEALYQVIKESYYEKSINEAIDRVIDDGGYVLDTASDELAKIRMELFRKRNELRRVFDKVISRLAKEGYTADIDESFSNGRRVVAVFSEHKRKVKGILHGESDTRKTAFIEPEETIDLNNMVYSLQQDEIVEIDRIFRKLTKSLSGFSGLLIRYLEILGEFDFIRAKAKLAISMNGQLPKLLDKAHIQLIDAYHPLLYLYNKQNQKPTIPLNITLDENNRILIISGPNAGGKTVAMKTIGLIQMMLQSGLLVPVSADSQIGVFKQLFIHIGDTQSIEFELSTYSSHLMHIKYFLESANGKTLFFIDELGSGSDPNLGGAFAEVILEELNRRHAMGIVTTHYLNLKVMASHVKGIFNGAMQFDELNLRPLYKLVVGKPGSSYTFAIAERIGLPMHLINRARKLVDDDHFRLDNLLNNTEQNLQRLQEEKKTLDKLLRENQALKIQMQEVLDQEKHKQQLEILEQQNKMSNEKLLYMKDTERKLKQVVHDWKTNEDKEQVIKNLYRLLFKNKERPNEPIDIKKAKKKNSRLFKELDVEIKVGSLVKTKRNPQVGEVKEIRGKRAIVHIGQLPMNLDLTDLIVVERVVIN